MTANTLDTISAISREFAMVLGNELDLVKRVNREFDSDFGVKSAQIGQTFNVRRPTRPTASTGAVIDIQAITETYSPLTFGLPFQVSYALTSQELTFSVEDYFSKVAQPSANVLASKIEGEGQALITKVYNAVGTPGTLLSGTTSRTKVAQALALLNKNAAPKTSGRKTLLNDPDFNGVMTDGNSALFNPQAEIAKMYTDGYQGSYASFMVFMNQLVLPHTNGLYGGTPVTNGVPAANAVWSVTGTLVTDGWTASTTTLNVGDIFTIAGVYAVNPVTKTTLGNLQQFAVQTATVTDGSGNSTITMSPALISTGGFQNVSNMPADGSTITVLGASTAVTQNALAFDKDAFMMAAKLLEMPSVGIAKVATDDQTGIPVRVWQAADIRTSQEIMRFDVNVAWGALYEQLACRIATT